MMRPMPESPPDYFEALLGAVERLKPNDRAGRGAIYERARRLLLQEAQTATPPWQLMEIVREQRALEEAILDIEARYTRAPERTAVLVRPPRAALPAPDRMKAEDFADTDPDFADEPGTPPPRSNGVSRPQPKGWFTTRAWWIWALLGVAGVILLTALFVFLSEQPAPPPPPPPPPPPAVKVEPPKPSAEELAARARSLIQRADDASRAGNFDDAIRLYTEAIGLTPVAASVYNNRAFAYWSRGQTDRAIADYDEAVRLDPKNVVALTNRAVALNFRGDYDAAIRDLDRALALRPNDPDVLNSRCWGRALAGQMQAALTDCNDALKLRPDDPNTLDSRGFTYLKMGEFDRAIADYTAALKADPQLAGALYGRGVARLRRGDKKGGAADIAAAKAQRPEIEAIFERYGIR
jgi:tetratricopeptide (TPR) repeat protein